MTDRNKASISDGTKKGICGDNKIVQDPEDRVRRQALQKIIAGVGMVAGYHVLPDKWVPPVVDRMVLPVHAATSGILLDDPCTVIHIGGDQSSATVQIKVSGFVTPPVSNLPVTISVITNLSTTPQITNLTTEPDGTFMANFQVKGGPGINSVSVTTTVTGAEGQANCHLLIPAPQPTPTTTVGEVAQ